METRYKQRLLLIVIAATLVFSIAMVLVLWVGIKGPLPLQANDYRVKVGFKGQNQIFAGVPVRIAGVNVGRVQSAKQSGEVTETTLSIYPKYAPLPRDVRATIRSATLIAGGYVVLSGGTAKGPVLRDGETIPAKNVAAQPQIVDLINALDGTARQSISNVAQEVQQAFGDSDAGSQIISNVEPFSEQLASLSKISTQRNQRYIKNLLQTAAAVGQDVKDSEANINTVVKSSKQALDVANKQQKAIKATVEALPSLNENASKFVVAAEQSVKIASPAIHDARSLTPKLPEGVASVDRILGSSNDLLDATVILLPKANKLLPKVRKLTGRVPRLTKAAETLVNDSVPLVERFGTQGQIAINSLAKLSSTGSRWIDSQGRVRYALRAAPQVFNSNLFNERNERLPSFRANAYPTAGWLDGMQTGGPPLAADCSDARKGKANGTDGDLPIVGQLFPLYGAPSCIEQPKWVNGDGTRTQYPLVKALPRLKKPKTK